MKAMQVKAIATVTLEKRDAGMTVTSSHLDVTADVPNASPAEFEKIAESARKGCIISRLLNAEITMDAKLGAGTRA